MFPSNINQPHISSALVANLRGLNNLDLKQLNLSTEFELKRGLIITCIPNEKQNVCENVSTKRRAQKIKNIQSLSQRYGFLERDSQIYQCLYLNSISTKQLFSKLIQTIALLIFQSYIYLNKFRQDCYQVINAKAGKKLWIQISLHNFGVIIQRSDFPNAASKTNGRKFYHQTTEMRRQDN